MSETKPLSIARTFLFVPGNRPERFMKAIQSGADAVVIDFEDSVPLAAKQAAQAAFCQAWDDLQQSDAAIVVRVNSPDTEQGRADLAVLSKLQGLCGVMVPKCESSASLAVVRRYLPAVPLLPIIESAAGFLALEEIAHSQAVARLVVGHIDFLADTGMQCSDDQRELDTLRFHVAMHTRQAGLSPAIDGVTVSVDDAPLIHADTLRSVRFGLGGKLCIHPRQVAVVHEALAPSGQEVVWARRVLKVIESSNGAAVQLDGKMVDLPVVLQAQRIMSKTLLKR